ncbi:MAG: aspartate kinase [Candidatus Marinimicrobia bacterium]|nr:aspartate kinase [Candidatus Neomarinimicrobiota bacterium]
MRILKFGGSSVATAERVEKVLDIIKESQEESKLAVVVSAFGGVTNQLIKMTDLAGRGDRGYEKDYKSFSERHTEMIMALTSGERQKKLLKHIGKYTLRLGEILRGVYLVRYVAPKTYNQILSYGERLSARIISQALCEIGVDADFMDARYHIRTDSNYGNGVVDFNITNSNIKKYFESHPKTQIITGFIASNANKETTVLGRSGSDYTAAIIGAAVEADRIEIWTDVDGIMTANPHQVPGARPILNMTYEDAMEMSHFGAKVLFPPTIQPAMQLGIPIHIKNTFNPDSPGTIIDSSGSDKKYHITGISSLDAISLIRIQGSGMVGKTGLTGRIFQTIAKADVGVMLISLASSEHSICFAVDPASALVAKLALEEEFQLELQVKNIAKILIEDNLCIVAVVGENMRHIPGIAGKVFSTLGEHGVNVVAIAQGSSERNISIVVSKDDETQVIKSLHETFFDKI